MVKLRERARGAKKQTEAAAVSNKKTAKKRKEEEEEEESLSEVDSIVTDGEDEENASAKKKTTDSGLLGECNKLFGSSDLYEVLGLNKASSLTDIKKAYHKLSLKVHPDKVDESLKEESKLKFQALGKVYTILSDKEKRRLYDETGVIDGENSFSIDDERDWDNYWRMLFRKVTVEDVNDFFKTYKDSKEEKDDLIKLYVKHKGDMDMILEEMLSESVVEDEERLRKIIQDAVDNKEVESFRKFSHETKRKKEQRKMKYEKEAKEAEELKLKLGYTGDIKQAIAKNQEARQKTVDSFFENLEAKYGKKEKAKPSGATKSRATKKAKKTEDDE